MHKSLAISADRAIKSNMIMKVFYALVALICVFLLFDSARITYAKHKAGYVDEAYIQEAQDADLEVVEFLDYSCPSCRSLHPVLKRAIEQDGRIRYIARPVLPHNENDIGMQASFLAIAAGKQNKFFEAHDVLIENFRNINEKYLSLFAQELELDEALLREELNDPDNRKFLVQNSKLLDGLKARTVPTLLINGKIVYSVSASTPHSEELRSLFNAARGL